MTAEGTLSRPAPPYWKPAATHSLSVGCAKLGLFRIFSPRRRACVMPVSAVSPLQNSESVKCLRWGCTKSRGSGGRRTDSAKGKSDPRRGEVHPGEVRPAEGRPPEVGPDVKVLFPPFVPSLHPLVHDSEMFQARHGLNCPATSASRSWRASPSIHAYFSFLRITVDGAQQAFTNATPKLVAA